MEPHLHVPRAVTSDSQAWVEALRVDGPGHAAAVERLHELLLRAARFEVSRRAASHPFVRGGDLDDLANQAADDALVAVLAKLDSYRGTCRFSTWAYKFALLEAAVRLRRRAWQGREIVMDSDNWRTMAISTKSPSAAAEATELLDAVRECIADGLTSHQRQVLVALAIDGVPIDVLAERLSSTRGALYKTLHDARRRLRQQLELRDLSPAA